MDGRSFFGGRAPVDVKNEAGASHIVLICEHASNYVPSHLNKLGLSELQLAEHIAWDPGALEVAEILSDLLDAPLVHAGASRLIIDINRKPDHPGSIVARSELTEIPANVQLSETERAIRREAIYEPFHARLEQVLGARQHSDPWVISIHSFTPIYNGVSRPWHIGILHDRDARLSTPLIDAFKAYDDLIVGDNEPYAPTDGVYHTIERHTSPFDRPGAMIEIRNDLIATRKGQIEWARRLYDILVRMRENRY